MDQIEWRDSELAETVAFLEATNPHGYTAASIKAHAYRVFAADGCKPTFIGTAGWYVSIVPKGYVSDNGTTHIALVSIMAFSAKRYLDDTKALLEERQRYYAEAEARFTYEAGL